MLTNLVLWFNTKRRLLTEYLLLGLLVSVAGLAFSFWMTRKEVKDDLLNAQTVITQVQGELALANSANEMNQNAIASLNSFRQIDSSAIAGLFAALQDINNERTAQDVRLQQLEKDNAEVTNYLDTPVPPQLACLLEPETCAAANSGGDKSSVPAAK